MFKILFGLVAALLSLHAQAALPTFRQFYASGYPSGAPAPPWSSTQTAACSHLAAAFQVSNPSYTWTATGYTDNGASGLVGDCSITASPGGGTAQHGLYAQGGFCPANSTLSGSVCNCNSGYAESGGSCVPSSPDCPVGQGRTFNRTEGWGRSPNADADDLVVDNGPPAFYDYDDGVCKGDIAKVERCFRSQEPSAQGLYRTSCDYTMVISGVTTGGDAAAKPTDPIAACPGVLGEVNGKPLCVGTAANPLPSGTAPPNEPTSAGNPSAGVKPTTGPGSGSDGPGRTPATGSGGNTGGPAGAAVGRGGTGDRGEPGEDGEGAVCGAPPLPACNVKVDETGTPAASTAGSSFNAATTALNTQTAALEGLMDDAKEIDIPGWSWSFSFPTGCTPLVLEAFEFELDVCQFQPVIHDLMSMVWVIAGFFGFLALFRETFGG